MAMELLNNLKKSKLRRLYFAIITFLPILAFIVVTDFNIAGQYRGFFLLKGNNGSLFELKDDLYLGDGSRLIMALDLPLFHKRGKPQKRRPGEVYLSYDWDNKEGSGYVRSYMPDGAELLTCFSRFRDSSGKYAKGLIVGGGLPESVEVNSSVKLNDTGMAYYDGKKWDHVWCSSNEAISPGNGDRLLYPSSWEYLGGKVLNEGANSLVIMSSHRVMVGGVPLHMDRYAYFRAGEPYFILSIWIKNTGTRPAAYQYLYGDEPWVGDYGSSKGNVGWVKGRIIQYETQIDPSRYSYGGLFDYGNEAIGEPHIYTMTANFIEWIGENRPIRCYFSNQPGSVDPKVPLQSDERFIGLEWRMHELAPGQSDNIRLVIGMAAKDDHGFPALPKIDLEGVE